MGGKESGAKDRDLVRAADQLVAIRGVRARHLPADCAAEPTWDMLLALVAAELAGRTICSAELIAETAIPGATVVRWLQALEERGLVTRRRDAADARRLLLSLAPAASRAMRACLSEVAALQRPAGVSRTEVERVARMAAELDAAAPRLVA